MVTNSWRFEILEELFDNVSLISSSYIALPLFPRPDKLTWIVDRKGVFSVKSALKLNQSLIWPANPDLVWHLLWKYKIHERLKTFVWRIGSGVLPTNLNVFSRLSKSLLPFYVILMWNLFRIYSLSVKLQKCYGSMLAGVLEPNCYQLTVSRIIILHPD